MNIIPVVLWSDLIIYILTSCIIFSFWYNRKNIFLQDAIAKIYQRPLKLAATLILLTYILIGFIDSFHFKKHL